MCPPPPLGISRRAAICRPSTFCESQNARFYSSATMHAEITRPRTAVGGAAPPAARPVAGALFGQSLLGYISPEPARLNGNTFPGSLLPMRRKGAQTMRRVRSASPLPSRAFDKSRLRQPDFRSDDSASPRWLRGARRGAAALSQASALAG
jgi:hypothetical protein